jgi:hypothetical protein
MSILTEFFQYILLRDSTTGQELLEQIMALPHIHAKKHDISVNSDNFFLLFDLTSRSNRKALNDLKKEKKKVMDLKEQFNDIKEGYTEPAVRQDLIFEFKVILNEHMTFCNLSLMLLYVYYGRMTKP